MSLDRSLKSANALIRHRNVLTRGERLDKLKEEEKWDESKSPLGLPKVAHRKAAVVKAVKEETAEGAAAPGTPGTRAATGAAAATAPAAGGAKGAAPAPAAGTKPAAGARSAAAHQVCRRAGREEEVIRAWRIQGSANGGTHASCRPVFRTSNLHPRSSLHEDPCQFHLPPRALDRRFGHPQGLRSRGQDEGPDQFLDRSARF